MNFYLVRHGQTDWNRDSRLQGQTDVPLNDAGRQQIEELAEKLAAAELKMDRIISSPLVRAAESAGIIARKIGFTKDIVIENSFIERDFGLLEGEPWYPELDVNNPKYKAERIEDIIERVRKALANYTFKDDESIMIVAHGALLPAIKTILSNDRIDYENRDVPIIQGNVMCCEKKPDGEFNFYNMF